MAENVFRGSGGGGGSSYKLLPDNLRSTDSFELAIGLGAGRWKGLVNGLKSLEINNVPLENADGTTNFEDFNVIFADGDPASQQHLTFKLGGGGGTTNVGTQIGNTNTSGPGPWVTAAVTTPNADFIDIRLVVSQLYHQDADGTRDGTMSLELEMRPSGAANWINPLITNTATTYNPNGFNVDDGYGGSVRGIFQRTAYDLTGTSWNDPTPGYIVITNKTTSPAVKEIRIAVPRTGNYVGKTWEVRIRMLEKELYQADPVEDRRVVQFESIAAISKTVFGATQAWNSLAWLQVIGKASSQLSGIPEIRGEYDTKIVKTPPIGVYNPTTRAYTGSTWDGTYSLNYTNDPAWCIKDLIEDPVSGIAAISPGATLDKWDALEASKYYSQLVNNGQGGTHPRFSLNVKIDQQQNAEELMQYIAGAVNSICVDTGDGKWRLKVDKPENPVMVFTRDNIEGDFSYQHTDVDSRFNDYTVTFANENNKYQEDRVRVYDQPHIDRFGRKPTTIAAVGSTNRQETLRRAYVRLRTSINETKIVNFVTNRQGMFVQPLQTILVADTDLGYVPPTGSTTGDPDADTGNNRTTTRIAGISGTNITLGSSVRLERGATYTVSVTYPNPNYNPDATTQPVNSDWTKPTLIATRTVTNANTIGARGDTVNLTIDSIFPMGVNLNAPIALSAVGMPTLPVTYRVLTVSPADDGERVSISAIIVDTGKWTATDAITESAIVGQTSSTLVDPPVAPSTGMFSIKTYTNSFGSLKRTLVVRWERPGSLWLNGFNVDYNFNDGPWIPLFDNTQETQVEIPDITSGKYNFRIIATDRRNGQSAPLIGTYIVSDIASDNPTRNMYRGDWSSSSIVYYVGDEVFFDGSTWSSTTNHTSTGANGPPTLPTTYNTNWTLRSRVGQAANNTTVWIHKRSAAAPALPTTTGTYTFSTGIITGLDNGWTAAVPADNGLPLYTSAANAYSLTATDTITAGEWASPVIEAQSGTAGLNTATVELFIRTSTSTPPAIPTATLTYTFATATLSGGSLAGWSQSLPTTGGSYRWRIAATALGSGATDTIATGEWSAQAVIAENGASAFTLINVANMMITSPNSVQKTSANSWDGKAKLLPGYGKGAVISYTLPPSITGVNGFIGLTTDPDNTSPDAYQNIDYSLNFNYAGQIIWYENGGAAIVASWTGGETITVISDNIKIRYYIGSTLLRERAVNAADEMLFGSVALYYINSTMTGFIYASAGSGGAQGVPGNDNFTWIAYADSLDGSVNFTTGAPAGRVFIGRADNKLVSTESTNPADYQWNPYTGPPSFGLVPSAGVNVASNRVLRIDPGPGWDTSAYTSESFTRGAKVSWKPINSSGAMMVGLNTDPTTDSSYTSLDFTWFYNNGSATVYESGSFSYVDGGTYSAADTFTVLYTDKKVYYLINGILKYTNNAPSSGLTLFLDSSIYYTNCGFEVVGFTASGADGVDGANGTPGAPGGDGTPSYVHIAYATAIDGSTGFSTTVSTGKTHIGVYTDSTLADSTNPANYSWSLIKGADGVDGNRTEFRWIRQYAPPSTPTGNDPSGWTTYILSGTATLWVTTGIKNSSDVLVGAWATPQLDGELVPRGPYNSGTTYFSSNFVLYNGGTYEAIQSNFSGQAPSGTDQDNAYWRVIAAPGAAGAPGTPPSGFTATIDLTSGAAVNLRTVADVAGYTGASAATITYRVPSGVVIRGLGGTMAGRGIDVGTWPGGYTIALTLIVQSGGVVDGGGGYGGAGGGGTGYGGGDAIYCQYPITITIDSGGTVRGGGGGAGGGNSVAFLGPDSEVYRHGGGGGGGGAPNGTGGAGQPSPTGGYGGDGGNGGSGTTSGGGSGGGGAGYSGGSGGTFATAGGGSADGVSGGAAGYAVRKNGYTVPVTNLGTMTGTAA